MPSEHRGAPSSNIMRTQAPNYSNKDDPGQNELHLSPKQTEPGRLKNLNTDGHQYGYFISSVSPLKQEGIGLFKKAQRAAVVFRKYLTFFWRMRENSTRYAWISRTLKTRAGEKLIFFIISDWHA